MTTKANRKQVTITHEDVQHAMRKFLDQGGLVKRLPDEVTPRGGRVGVQHAVYEDVVEGFSYDAGSESAAGNA